MSIRTSVASKAKDVFQVARVVNCHKNSGKPDRNVNIT
jgi:hypothetical protein